MIKVKFSGSAFISSFSCLSLRLLFDSPSDVLDPEKAKYLLSRSVQENANKSQSPFSFLQTNLTLCLLFPI